MGGAGFVYYNSLLLRAISIASEDNDHWELVQFALMKKVNLLSVAVTWKWHGRLVNYSSLLLFAISIASGDHDHRELLEFSLIKKVSLF
jgi:hypothetical protein